MEGKKVIADCTAPIFHNGGGVFFF
jgi:hypothetical protein